MKYCILASGSKGNSTWVETDNFAFLIDNGLSGQELLKRVSLAGLNLAKLKHIFVTHEHLDHVRGVGPLARKLALNVFTNKLTANGAGKYLEKVKLNIFETGTSIFLDDLEIEPLAISHDTQEPVAYKINKKNKSLAVLTDLGTITNLLRLKLKNLNALVLEFNHDFKMLMDGPYPWFLKQRIRDRKGHLANEEAAEFVTELYSENFKHLVLAHLSETNNAPELAKKAILNCFEKNEFKISVASPNLPSKILKSIRLAKNNNICYIKTF